jgi:hypothetical protein
MPECNQTKWWCRRSPGYCTSPSRELHLLPVALDLCLVVPEIELLACFHHHSPETIAEIDLGVEDLESRVHFIHHEEETF